MPEGTSHYIIRELTNEDRGWVKQLIRERWGDDIVVAHDMVYCPSELPGFAAFEVDGKRVVGIVTYRIEQDACEIVTLDSLIERQGIGARLIEAVRRTSEEQGCNRLWLVTTNDNLSALLFYQKCGFRLTVVHKDAVERARKIKPSIPLTGEFDIPIRDELELEIRLVE